jgi:hypothetical protein
MLFPWLLWGAVGFDLKLNQRTPYLGEPVVATLRLAYTPDTKVDRVRIVPPRSEAFEIRILGEESPRSEDGKLRRLYRYLLTPLRVGPLTLPPFKAELTWQDPKTYLYTVHSYHTAPAKLTVREVPGGLTPVGDLRLRLRSDRNATEAYAPVHLELTVSGEGNLEFLKPFSVRIPSATVYPSAPKVTIHPKGKSYITTFRQRFTVLSDREIRVPPLRLLYFNTKTGIPETLQSRPLTITVKNPAARREFWLRVGLLLGGALLGAMAVWLWMRYFSVRFAGGRFFGKRMSDRELYRKLLPYSGDPRVRELIDKLEGALYRGEKVSIDRREAWKLLRTIKRSGGKSG